MTLGHLETSPSGDKINQPKQNKVQQSIIARNKSQSPKDNETKRTASMLFPRSPSVRINVQGARIVEDDDTPQTGRDIQFPYHDEAISHIAVDIGGSLAKCVYFKRDVDSGVRLNFTRFETANIAALIEFLGALIRKRGGSGTSHRNDICVMATGGGAYLFYERIKRELGVDIYQEDEMQCLIVGLDFFINEIPGEVFTYGGEENPMDINREAVNYPYLLVNIGSGVSMIKVSGPENFERIGGSSLGGGTLWGLLSLLTGAKSFDEMLNLSSEGDNTQVDMLVGDIYGHGYGKIGLKASTIASSFGKVFHKQRQHERELAKEAEIANIMSMHGLDQDGVGDGIEGDGSDMGEISGYKTPESMENGVRMTSLSDPDPDPDPSPSTSTSTSLCSSSDITKTSTLAARPSPHQKEQTKASSALFAPADISRSLLYAISNNIGQIAYLQAQKHDVSHIYFGGSYIRGHSQTMLTLSYAIKFWSGGEKQAYFLRHEGYLGAVGAFLLHQPKDWGRRGSMSEGTELPMFRKTVLQKEASLKSAIDEE